MKLTKKGLSRTLAMAVITILAFSLAACQASSTATATATAAPTETPVVTATATVAPIVLEGAVTTDSGLQYLEETAGSGATPKAGDLITMDYIATLPDGTELVNTYTQGKSVTTVWGKDRLLPGWEEGVGLMKAGGKAKLVLPAELAFGAEGYGTVVPANSQIVLEVSLLTIETPPAPTTVAEADLTTSETGLQYYDLATGSGDATVKSATVTTNYTLWVKNDSGYEYIDSSATSAPLEFVVGRGDIVFPGWEEGVTGMKVGGKRYLVIPSALGFGETENGVIPANSTLVMEIELVSMVPPQVMTQVSADKYTVTASGLKYFDMVAGTGDAVAAGATVKVNYTGWLEDGTQFDSSLASGTPFSFTLGQNSVIAGWEEGLLGMKVGGKRQLVIPAALGYGDTGSGIIPGGATLIFEIELLEITPAQ